MEFIGGLISNRPYLLPITHFIGWLGMFVFLVIILLGARRWWEEPSSVLRRRWWLFLILIVATPFTSTLLGMRLPGQTLPLPGVPFDAGAAIILFLGALPMVLAGGLLGPLPAMVVGALTGLMVGLFSTHSPFAPLEMTGLALLFSVAVRQRYRTPFYKLLRHPLGAAVVLAVVYAPVYMASTLLAVNGPLAVRLDYALTQTWQIILARGMELVIASLVGELFYLGLPLWWGCLGPLLPSPAESSLKFRFLQGSLPLLLILFFSLTLGDWLVAGRAARQMVEERLSSSARMAVESIPFFLESGQSLIQTMAQPELILSTPQDVSNLLAARLRSVPFFRQLTVFDAQGVAVGGYPESNFDLIYPSKEELAGVTLALSGVSGQVYTIPPLPGEKSAQVSFLAIIPGENGAPAGVLLGRTDLSSNPFTQQVVLALQDIRELQGQGFLLDENRRILYPVDSMEISTYQGSLPGTSPFYSNTLPDGTRAYSYYQEALGRPWSIILAVPAQYTQEVALNIAVPLMIMLGVIIVAGFVLLRISLNSISGSLSALARQATLITRGDLNQTVMVKGEDEVGQLANAFERMRVSLKSRLDELNRLLVVSQSVAAHLEIDQAVGPILTAAIQDGGCLSRAVFTNEVILDATRSGPVVLTAGAAGEQYAHLDAILFEQMRHQDLMPLGTIARMRRLSVPAGKPMPGALVALAIRHKDHYFGVFWLAYETPRTFQEEEIRFLSTLAGQIALAAFSARLYAQAEIGRQRLEAVLASTPEPVLVFDEQSRLLLYNNAALEVPGLMKTDLEGAPITDVLGSTDLTQWLTGPSEKRLTTKEINLSNGRVYYTSVSAIQVEGRPFGRICMMRDITHYKELDQLKSDFVATVSHDLRSPLTLMRGYSTMLSMVGELNEQQKSYVKKINGGVEAMSKLVNNLLDLGRIEAGVGLQIEKVVMQQVIDEVINSLQAQAVQKELQLSQIASGEGTLAVIEADRALVQQALYNLVENAIKYTPQKGQVQVRMDVKPATVLVQVVDSGIGIAPLDLPRLFEKFYRSGRREAFQQRGTGLGLAIVKSIAERHHGRVSIDSTLGKGSIFSIELPIYQPTSDAVAVK